MRTGCRLNEIQTLRWEDVDLDSTELRLRDSKIAAQERRSFTPLFHATLSRRSFTPLFHAALSRRSFTPLFHAALSRRSFTPLFASCEPFPVQVTFPGS